MAPAVNYSACTAAGFPSRLERRPTAAFQWLRRRGPLCWLRKELGNVDGQRLGEAIEHVDGRVFLLPLQAADVRRFSYTWKSHRRDRTGCAALRRFRSRMDTGRTGVVIGGSESPPGTSAIGASPAAAVTELDGAV